MNDRMDEIRSTRAPTLREDQIEILRRYGQKRKTEVGDVLFRAGDTHNDFIVILEGEVEVVDDFAGDARTIGVFLAGRFLGELNMLTGQAMYLTAVVREGGEVLAITRERLKEIVTEEPNLSDVILKAFLARRTYMIRTGLGLRIIGSRHSSDAARLREVAARNRVPHVWIELVEDPEAEALLERFGAKPSETPVTLAGRTRRVYLLLRGEDLGKNMSSYLVDRITDAANIELLLSTEVRELTGEDRLKGVVIEDNRSGERRTLGARALFVFIGAEANTGWLEGSVELDERGFVLTGRELNDSALDEDAWQERLREPFLLETSMPGVFAAGDVRSGSIKRCASAVGEGSMAVRLVHQHLADAGVQKA